MRKLTLVFLLLLSGYGAFAQAKFGVKAGVNFSNLRVDDNSSISDESFKPGLNFGSFVKVPIVGPLSFQPELLFSQKGARYDFLAGNATSNLNLTYLDVPLLGVINLGDNINLHAGPQFGMLFGARQVIDGNILGVVIDREADVRENFKGIDAGLVAGIGFEVHNFNLNLRYNLGLNTIYKENQNVLIRYNDARNQVIQLQIGVHF